VINRYGVILIVEAWIKNRHVSPFRVIRNDDGVTRAVGQGQKKAWSSKYPERNPPHIGAEYGVGAVADSEYES